MQYTKMTESYGFEVTSYESDITQFLHNSSTGTTPIYVSDISSSSFTISWVSSTPVTGSVEYSTSSDLSSPSTKTDLSPLLASGAVLVQMTSLVKNTVYYYRTKSVTATGEIRYYPGAAPYPYVITKNSTQPGYASNPTCNIAPFEDLNGNNAWDGQPPDAKDLYFLVYMNHTGAETLAARGSSSSGWVATRALANLRDNNAEGAPHKLNNGDAVTFYIAGVSSGNLRVNLTATFTWNGVEDPVDRIWKTVQGAFASTFSQWSDSARGTSSSAKSKRLPELVTTTPITSDITSNKFRASWVADVPIKGAIEYCVSGGSCGYNSLSSTTTVNDPSPYLASGTALVEASSLVPGTTYYYRFKATLQSGDVVYYPYSPPYPSVTTKTDTLPGYPSNPTFNVAPFYDKNNNGAWNGEPPDAKQNNFLIYLNHTGTETLVARGNPWIAAIATSNLRNATASGSPHLLTASDQVTFWIAGMYNDGQRSTFWRNATPAYTWSGGSPVNLVYRTERQNTFSVECMFAVEPVWLMDPKMGTQYGGPKKVQGIFSKLWLGGDDSRIMTVSDITTARFRVSWMNEYPATGSVEYSVNSDLSGSSTVIDSSPNLANGTSMVTVASLTTGTTYYYRVKVQNATGGDIRYFPSSPPYPSVTTKTSTDTPPISNPTLNFAIYNDKNGNGAYNSGEPKLLYFLVYFTHSGAGTMVARGSAGSGWIATIVTKNLRDDSPEGRPHQFSITNPFSLSIRGLYDDGTGKTLWKNDTYATTWDGSTTDYYVRCVKSTIAGLSGTMTARLRFSTTGDILGTPFLSDVTTSAFRVSWVNQETSSGYVQYSMNSDLSGYTTVADTSLNLANGTSIVTVPSLSAGTTYYYRTKTTNATGGNIRYFPSTAPYLSVITKTSTTPGSPSNPVFSFAMFDDRNWNSNYDTGEPKLNYFVVYLSHTGAGLLAERGRAGSGWIASIDTKNLRDDTAAGNPHPLSIGDQVTITAKGLYDDGTGKAYWKMDSFTVTWDGSTTNYYIRCAKSAVGASYIGTTWMTFNGTGWSGAGLSPFYDMGMFDAGRGVASSADEIAYTSNGGQSFSVSNDSKARGFDWYGASMGSATAAWVAGSRSGSYRIIKSTDGGSTWTTQKEGSGTLRSVSFSGTSNGVAVGDGKVFYTTNGGTTWTASADADIGATRYNRVTLMGTKAMAVGAGGKILVNADITVGGGGDWVPKTSGTSSDLYGASFTGALAIAVGNAVIIRSTDGGNTWGASTSASIGAYGYRGVSTPSATLAWAVGEYGRLLRSTDGGVTWSALSSDNIAFNLGVTAPTTGSGIIVGAQGTITVFDGTAWRVHTVPAESKVSLSMMMFGTRTGNVTLRYDSTIYDSRYSIKALSIARCESVKTYWKSGVATGQWAASYKNENSDNDTVVLKASVNMTKTLFNNSEIDKAYVTVRNQTSGAIVWSGYMSKESAPDSQHWVFKVSIGIATWNDGKYKVVVTASELDSSTDAALGESNAKTTFFIIT